MQEDLLDSVVPFLNNFLQKNLFKKIIILQNAKRIKKSKMHELQ
jgi:hypothetical protein